MALAHDDQRVHAGTLQKQVSEIRRPTTTASLMSGAGFSAATILSRREFELGRRAPIETAGLIASDRVTVTLDIGATES